MASKSTADDRISGVSGSWVEFYRTSGSTQGVIFQNTARTLPTGAPLEATFTLGNGDAVRKRVTVVLHDSDFSDSVSCNFWPFDTPRRGGSGQP